MWELTNGVDFYGVNRKNIEKKFQFGTYVLWFPKGEKTHTSGQIQEKMVWSIQGILLLT